jgi:hypothetical protein
VVNEEVLHISISLRVFVFDQQLTPAIPHLKEKKQACRYMEELMRVIV